MILGDFHIHSNFSDGKNTIPELIDIYGKRGFGVIAITDHICEEKSIIGKAARYIGSTLTQESFNEYIDTISVEAIRAWKKYRMIVMPGYELTKNTLQNYRSAHLIALGCNQYTSADGDIFQLITNVKKLGALAIAAHPVSTRKLEKQTYHLWDQKEELLGLLDAWEVASGPFLFDEVLQSGLPMIANSDYHRIEHMTSWKTVIDSEKHPEAILEAIKNQKIKFMFYKDKLK